MNITFICTGNTCRSPMAEGIAKKILAERRPQPEGVQIFSAGTDIIDGFPPSENAVTACREIGVDISEHLSVALNDEILHKTDVFAVMTEGHARRLRRLNVPSEKIRILGGGVPDPYGKSLATYRECRDAILAGVEKLLDELLP